MAKTAKYMSTGIFQTSEAALLNKIFARYLFIVLLKFLLVYIYVKKRVNDAYRMVLNPISKTSLKHDQTQLSHVFKQFFSIKLWYSINL